VGHAHVRGANPRDKSRDAVILRGDLQGLDDPEDSGGSLGDELRDWIIRNMFRQGRFEIRVQDRVLGNRSHGESLSHGNEDSNAKRNNRHDTDEDKNNQDELLHDPDSLLPSFCSPEASV